MLLSELTGIRPTRRSYLPSGEFYDPTGIFGIEIEVEFDTPKVYRPNEDFWRHDSDGSLRGWNAEYISDPPIFGADAVRALTELSEEIEEYNPNCSWRCGLHVHLDVSGLTVLELLAFVVGCSLVEPALFRYVGMERKENINCLPFADTGNVLTWLNGIKYGNTNNEILSSINSLCKYSGINLKPITYQGSVEFRHHKGTYDAKRIMEWVNILMRIKGESIKHHPTQLASLSREEISERLLDNKLEYTQNDYLTGYLTAKDVLNFNKLEDDWENIKAPYFDPSYLTFEK